jgi:cyclic pyranopterin phosphate synthase
MPETGIYKMAHDQIMRSEEIIQIVREMAIMGVNKVRLTGGEPLSRKGIVSLVREIKAIESISDLSMTTNGYKLEEYLDELIDAGLDRLNISLDTLKPDRFTEITRGGQLEPVLRAIDKACQSGIKKVKINTVLIGGFNEDEIGDLIQMTKDRAIDVRFIELMPIGQAANWAKEKFVSNGIVLQNHEGLIPVDYFDPSSPARYYQIEGHKGLIGLINPISCNFCSNCNRIRLTADGKLKPCLHSDMEVDVLNVLRNNPSTLLDTIKQSVVAKPKEHHINEKIFEPIKRNMNRIGG